MRKQLISNISATLVLCAIGSATFAQEITTDGIWQVDEFSCRDLLLRGGSERDFAILFLHGYVSGKTGDAAFDAVALTGATDKAVQTCIDAPDTPVLSAFEQARD